MKQETRSQAMSRRLKTARNRVETWENSKIEGSSILDSVHALDSAELKGSELICEFPLCDVRFRLFTFRISLVRSEPP